jgi:hypothetical protein
VAYSTVAEVKAVLNIVEDDYNTEITVCVVSADALIDGLCKAQGLSVPTPVPQLVKDGSKQFAAWVFKKQWGDPEAAEHFYEAGLRFVQAHIDGALNTPAAEGEADFRAVSDQ